MKTYETPAVQVVALTPAEPVAFGDNNLPLASPVRP